MYRHGSRDRGFAADRGIASGETESRTERPATFRDNSIQTGSYRIYLWKGMARCMKTKVPHNVLTISEMTKRPNKIRAEVIDIDNIVLDDELIKKLRASKSMFNKSTYVQILCGGIRYNVEGVDRLKNGKYRITLISPEFYATLTGAPGENVNLVKLAAIS